MTFANRYRFAAPSRFNRVIPATDGGACAIGEHGNDGLVTRLDAAGGALWSRRHVLEGMPLSFFDGVVATGGFVLLATLGGAPDYDSIVVVRIDAAGEIVWARRLFASVPGGGSIARPGPWCRIARWANVGEEFAVSAWPDHNPAIAHLYAGVLVRLGANGAVLNSVTLANPDGGRVFAIEATPAGYRLIGDADDLRTPAQHGPFGVDAELDAVYRFGLVVDIESSFDWAHGWLLAGSEMVSLRGAASPGDATELVGITRPQTQPTRSTLVLRLEWPNGEPHPGTPLVFGNDAGDDRPARIIRIGANRHAILDMPTTSGSLARLDGLQPPVVRRAMVPVGQPQLRDLAADGSGAALAAGAIGAAGDRSALLLGLDASLDCCRIAQLPAPATHVETITVMPTSLEIAPADIHHALVPIAAVPIATQVESLCGAAIEKRGEQLVQSPYLNLQAAGSQGVGAARGVLLRWFFDKALGAAHLPKGNLASTATSFNRPDDFVTLHRAEWPAVPRVRRVDFATSPVSIDPQTRVLAFRSGPETPGSLVYLRFIDAAAFAAARQSANAMSNPMGFLAAYGAHPIEIELRGRIALACDLGFEPAVTALRVETLSVPENRPLAPKKVSSRRVLGAGDGPVARLVAENLRSLRVECTGGRITSVAFLCYDDILSQLNDDHAWVRVGDYALSLDQNEVFRRLEDSAHFQVHNHWRRFNDGALVNIANYHARWSMTEGLRTAVQRYVQLSDTNPQALAPYAAVDPQVIVPDPNLDLGSMSVSYLSMLNLVATDFHVARLLGLGCVDPDAVDAGKTYLHLIDYVTEGDLGDGVAPRKVQHFYMGLPTRLDQERLPAALGLDPVEYGLSIPAGSGASYSLTDAAGYTPDATARYIRLYPDCPPLYAGENGFFDPPLIFDLAVAALPVFYGIEYRGTGEAAWHRPEIAHDPAWLDTGSPAKAEPRPSPFPASKRDRAFIHKETEPGPHEYAAYAIDLFSRGAPASPVRGTDTTVFVRANRLLPPTDLSVQLIQPEGPLVLTSQGEQDMLTALTTVDKTLARVCFNYGFVQDAAYDFAANVEIFFRDALPASVAGGITAFAPAGPSRIRIELGPYTFANPSSTTVPSLISQDAARFIGGVLVAGGRRLIIEQVDAGVPAFTVVVPQETGVEADGGVHTLVTGDADLGLAIGDLATAIENMAAAANWGTPNPLSTKVTIGHPSWLPRIEAFTRPDGTTVSRRLGGVWSNATVTESPTGSKRYEIQFNNYQLPPHPQSAAADPVEWWRGAVRLSVAGRDPEDRRAITVKVIDTSGSALKLIAFDESGDPATVVEGSGQLVNFYPGYRVYLHADPPGGFVEANILPPRDGWSRTTLLGLRSVDPSTHDGNGDPYRSAIGVPQLLTARELRPPLRPRKPGGLAYATPPDAERKSSYTLNAEFNHEPFAAAFFRADAFGLLSALYSDSRSDPETPSTYEQVIATILPIERDPWIGERFDDLFAYLEPGSTAAAPAPFPLADETDYALPLPDAENFADREAMREAMLAAFTALTEQPLIFKLISEDPGFIPSKRRQTVRDSNGDLLYPGDSGFDLSPMARRPGGDKITFTDFTLDGSMHPDTLYFYFIRELGNQMEISDASPIFGPVKLVDLAPPTAPVVRNLASRPFNVATGAAPQVTFEVMAPSPLASITRLRIYRTTDPAKALSVRTMDMVADIALAPPPATDGVLTVTDAFDADPPYGDPLCYRLVWVREVAYDDLTLGAQIALAVSEPSPRLLTNIADVVNPQPPLPSVVVLSDDGNGNALVRIDWTKSVHNGAYLVSHLNPLGIWSRVAALASNATQLSVDLTEPLPMTDEDGNAIWHRFKIDVENSSGLVNSRSAPVTVDLTAP